MVPPHHSKRVNTSDNNALPIKKYTDSVGHSCLKVREVQVAESRDKPLTSQIVVPSEPHRGALSVSFVVIPTLFASCK